MNQADNTINNEVNNVPVPSVDTNPVVPTEPVVVAPPEVVPVSMPEATSGVEPVMVSPEIAPLNPEVLPTTVAVSVDSTMTPTEVPTSITSNGQGYFTPPPVPLPQAGQAVNIVVTPVPIVPAVSVNPTPAPQNVGSDYKPPSKMKVFGIIFLFVLLIGFIVFLPKINDLIGEVISGNDYGTPDVITTGKLKCTATKDTSNLDISYNVTFTFTDSELKTMEYVIITKGDASMDEEELEKLQLDCETLKAGVESLEGVTIRCNSTKGEVTETQYFDLSSLNEEKLDSAFYEAGGNAPEFTYNQNIDGIEKSMNASGYSCNREK